jgi:hypothetical protein
MTELQGSAQTILNQLSAAQSLTAGAVYSAGQGDILAPGIMQTATITEQMRVDYNADVQGVIDATYYNAELLFQDNYVATMANLDTAVDNLVAATAVLMEVQAVANMAANADTVQEANGRAGRADQQRHDHHGCGCEQLQQRSRRCAVLRPRCWCLLGRISQHDYDRDS